MLASQILRFRFCAVTAVFLCHHCRAMACEPTEPARAEPSSWLVSKPSRAEPIIQTSLSEPSRAGLASARFQPYMWGGRAAIGNAWGGEAAGVGGRGIRECD